MNNDRRLIEDYLPIEAISKEASREKSVRKGHISTLHLWWARRPLVACRAAVYGALVPAARFAPKNGPEEKRGSLTRANAAKFVDRLCKYPGDPSTIAEAQRHILEAHAERLTKELADAKAERRRPTWADEFKFNGERVSVNDIDEGRAPRPRVLDMFAGGGAIPLEALRLGCEAYAMDLNPVAYIIELCTLVYPQKYGKPDPSARGMTGPKNAKGETTWGGLAKEVRYWGDRVLTKVKAELSDFYPLIPDPEFKGKRKDIQTDWLKENNHHDLAPGYLIPVAYLWTRTVRCKNPNCGATVPLARQTWLSKKPGRYVALQMIAPTDKKHVEFRVVQSRSENGLGFDPEAFSKGGNASCPFCGTVADSKYVKNQGSSGALGTQLLAVACENPRGSGNIFVPEESLVNFQPSPARLDSAEAELAKSGILAPSQKIVGKAADQVPLYGMPQFKDLFPGRARVFLMQLAANIRNEVSENLVSAGSQTDHANAVRTYLAVALDRVSNYLSSLCIWRTNRSCVLPTFSRQALAMTWDYGEMNPFSGSAGDWAESVDWVADVIEMVSNTNRNAQVYRNSADDTASSVLQLVDAVITDPPYYDNVIYADLSDFFYVWLRLTIGDIYPDHFASELTPKRKEIVSSAFRHSTKLEARTFYEEMMAKSLGEAYRILKPGAPLVCVYAHKTTLGWATLVDSLRESGFQVNEAWPVDTEMTGGMRTGTASLASSIFLIAQKREASEVGDYEQRVRPDLAQIVQERVETLWEMGVSGADLVVACVGAGLRAFTRFARVEYANGENVPAERFLSEVETVVLETILRRLSREVGDRNGWSLAGLDAATRFYILWRYTYRSGELEPGEAIVFANGTHVELDGAAGLSAGVRALIEKKRGQYRLLDYTERGADDKLGIPEEDGHPVPLIDVLHRTLWLMEKRPGTLPEFLREAQPNREQMRLVAQALAGPALKGGELADVSPSGEMAALAKLTANWRSVVEDQMLPLFNR